LLLALFSFHKKVGFSIQQLDLFLISMIFSNTVAAGRRFLATKSFTMGFTKELVREGNGSKPRVGQMVTVHCTGYGKNRDLNVKFWSTKDPGQQVCPPLEEFISSYCFYDSNDFMCVLFVPFTNFLAHQPFSFQVGMGKVIKGWDESVIDMSLGEISRIHCSPDFA
jgi:peptidylprolyl isomerase